MPQLLKLPQFQYPENADVSKNINLLADVLGKQFENARNQQRLMAIGQAAKGGNLAGARDAAFEGGDVSTGLQISGMLDKKEARAEDTAWRKEESARTQSNADRAFGLKEKELGFEMGHKNALLGLKRMEMEFKQQGGYKDLKERADVESGLRKEFSKHGDDYIKVRDAYGRVQASAQDPSAAGDMAMIFSFMKILDPGSTVREGEYATAQNAGSVSDKVRGMYNAVLNGEKLAPTIRNDFLNRSTKLFEKQEQSYKQLESQFTGIGNRLGVDVRNVVPEMKPGGAAVDWQDYFKPGQK